MCVSIMRSLYGSSPEVVDVGVARHLENFPRFYYMHTHLHIVSKYLPSSVYFRNEMSLGEI